MTSAIELQEQNIIQFLKENIAVLKEVEDEKVKTFLSSLEEKIGKYDEVVEDEQEGNNETEVPGETSGTEVQEEKVEESTEEVVEEKPAEEKPEEKPPEAKPAEPVEQSKKVEEVSLSKKVAETLKQAALELQSKDQELQAKNEIIDGFKNKVSNLETTNLELQKQVQLFIEKERLELSKKKEALIGNLIELYKGVSITKTTDDLQKFNVNQLIELQKALEVTVEKKNTLVRETTQTVSNTSQVVKQPAKSESKQQETEKVFEGLFGATPFY